MMNKIVQAIVFITLWLFWQVTATERWVMDEALKYGLSLVFLIVALVYVWKDWQRERRQNDLLNGEIKNLIKGYHSAISSKDDNIRDLVEAIRNQNQVIVSSNRNLEELARSVSSHNEEAARRTQSLEKITRKLLESGD